MVPELPTIAESGLPGFSVYAWFGLLAPVATPAEIVTRISAEIQKGFKTPQMRERFSAMGADPVGGSPEQFAAFLKVEMAKWAKLCQSCRHSRRVALNPALDDIEDLIVGLARALAG